MISWPLQRKILQILTLISGIYIMFPTLDILRTIYQYSIIEFVTPSFLIGILIIYYAIMSLRGRM